MRTLAFLLCLTLLLAPVSSQPAHAQDDEAVWLLAQINALRQRNGQVLLSISPHLTTSAVAHSTYLATHPYGDPHREANGSTPATRALAAGYPGRLVGENVVGGTGANVQWAFTWWMKSPLHLHNMLVGWTEIGIGIVTGPYGRWYTTDFGDQGAGLVAPTDPPPAPGTSAPDSAATASGGTTNDSPAPKADIPRPTRRPTKAPTLTPTITLTPSITYTPRATFTPTFTPTGLPPTFTPIVLEVSPPPTVGQPSEPTTMPATPSPSSVAVAMAIAVDPPSVQPAAPPPSDPIRGLLPWLIGLQGIIVGGWVAGSVIRRRRRS